MSLRTIVVGIDDSPGSRHALRFAAELAAPHRARIVAVHCFEPLAHLAELQPGIDLRALRERTKAVVESELCKPLVEAGLEYSVLVREGEPATVLADAANEVDADLVVVGSRRMGFLEGLALGSTSKKLSKVLRRPFAIVPIADAAAG